MLREKIFTGCSTNKSFVTQPGVLYCLFRWNNFTFGEKKHSIVSLRLTRFFHSIFSIIFSTVVVFAAADHQFTEDDWKSSFVSGWDWMCAHKFFFFFRTSQLCLSPLYSSYTWKGESGSDFIFHVKIRLSRAPECGVYLLQVGTNWCDEWGNKGSAIVVVHPVLFRLAPTWNWALLDRGDTAAHLIMPPILRYCRLHTHQWLRCEVA